MQNSARRESADLPVHSIDEALRELRSRPRSLWLELVCDDQSARWRSQQGVPAEEYLERLPELTTPTEDALVLICREVVVRRELGDKPSLGEYQTRFPDLAEELALQFEVDRMLNNSQNGSAPTPIDAALIANTELAPTFSASETEVDLAGFEFLEELGRGTSGIVYKAMQLSLRRFVAVKVLTSRATNGKRFTRQWQEAQILARLHHPNIVQIYEVVFHDGLLYLIMEFVEGSTLCERTTNRLLSPREAAELTATLAAAIQAVHEAGIFHRDLKPGNVLMTSGGEPKITDFGLAKQRSNINLLTTQDSILGTPSYMAPEQAAGDVEHIGVASDVYSLGAILYELLTGRPPFLGASVLDTLSQIREREPVPLRHLQPQVPRDVETICLKCLDKAPLRRYISAESLASDLRAFLQGKEIVARRANPWERTARFIKRRPSFCIAIASLVLFIAASVVFAWIARRQRQELAAADLVESIADADPQALPGLLGRITAPQPEMVARLRAALAATRSPEMQWVNLSLAELDADPKASPAALMAYLPIARSAEIPLIVPRLASHAATISAQLWLLLLEPAATSDTRLRLACLAARIAPDDPRWSSIAGDVATAMIRQPPLDLGIYSTALAPARTELIPALEELSIDAGVDPFSRRAVVGILAHFAADRPKILVDLASGSDREEFRLLIPALRARTDEVRPLLLSRADRSPRIAEISDRPSIRTKHDIESAYDAAQRSRANALVALWLLGQQDRALDSLRRESDPTLRAWLIELLAPLGISAESLLGVALETADEGVRHAAILALGQSNLNALKRTDREDLIRQVITLYSQDPDPGTHSACRWLLTNRLNQSAMVAGIDVGQHEIDPKRRWYIGPNGHTFSIVRSPITFTMGSPPDELSREEDEAYAKVQLDHGFAISTTEVTSAEFRHFRDDADINSQFSPTDDCPANDVSWFDAAAYCRWLSEQAKLPETQMCYPPLPEIKPGMHLPHDWLRRTGYRLPTAQEWEYACRGGVSASRPSGEGAQLLHNYAWYLADSEDHAWPVGELKPNNFGMFDMLGNVLERCQVAAEERESNSEKHSSQERAIDEPESAIERTTTSELRGGNFGDSDQNVRSARRYFNSVRDKWASVGFRVARTL